jgi:zinc protease
MPHPAPFAERVRPQSAGVAQVLALRTPVDRVVSFEASFQTLPDFGGGEELLQKLTVMLLDKGTRRQDRHGIAEALEDRGARLSFSAEGLRCGFAGRCLRDDLPDVLALAAEQLREPLLDPEEFAKAKARQAAALRRALDDTGTAAHNALVQRLYDDAHPNHRPDPRVDLGRLEGLTIEDVREYHARHFGARGLWVVVVGDVDPVAVLDPIRRHLGDWPEPSAAGPFAEEATPQPPARVDLPIPEKENLDVRIGHALPLRRDAEDYLPLYAGVYALGGNFSARLMARVRDEQGLTYGIGARLAGMAVEHDGYFLASVTLSRQNLERGIEATLHEIRALTEEGVTDAELAEVRDTLAGAFQVGLATTGGLAGTLLTNAERGFPVDYLDRFPDLVRGISREQANAAIARYLRPDALHTVVAGTFPALMD